VRRDICTQLGLTDPLVLVGNFDRPNLTYRVLPKLDLTKQIREVLDRHPGEAGIIYCIRRKDVDETHAMLQSLGYNARPYHAGMSSDDRSRAQDEFAEERCDLIVATVAFGMGIDRSNIRFILHTGMPKSIEHYQQETGRAGRDGLEAECVLLHSGTDFATWKYVLEKSAQENEVAPDFLPNAMKHLNDMDRYARSAACRHRALVQYFGQSYDVPSCKACDICLGDVELVPDSTVIAQKILSCVARVQERFGINHVISVLRGEDTERVRNLRHDQLSTYGLLQEHPKVVLRDWIYQLIGHGVLLQEGDEYPILRLNDAAWEVMRKQREVALVQLVRRRKGEKAKSSQAATVSWEGVDKELFEALRGWRGERARQAQKPAYIIFSDATLRELARTRPSTLEALRQVYGIGEQKLRELGEPVLSLIASHCRQHGLATDVSAAPQPPPAPPKPRTVTASSALACTLFRLGTSVEDVMHQTKRSRTTVYDYLCEYIRAEKPADVRFWVEPASYDAIAQAARAVGTDRLKPIFLQLGEKYEYDTIRVVVAHLTRNG
jgi:ATP-dependent DNA helicase RecQ